MKLSEAQEHALMALDAANGLWLDAYTLNLKLNVLNALVRKDMAEKKVGAGSMAFPHTSIDFRITAKGREYAMRFWE